MNWVKGLICLLILAVAPVIEPRWLAYIAAGISGWTISGIAIKADKWDKLTYKEWVERNGGDQLPR